MEAIILLLLENLPAIIKMFEDCTKRDGEAKLFKRLRNPGLVERWTLRQLLAQQGLKGRELRDAVAAGMDWLKTTDEETLKELLSEAKAGTLQPNT